MLSGVVLTLLAADPVALASRPAVASQLGEAVEVHYDARGRVTLTRGELGRLPNDATEFLRERAAPLGLRGDETLAVLRDERAPEGTRHVRVGRVLGGIPVAFDQLRVHARADGSAYAIEAETSALESFTYAPPRLLPKAAIDRASGGYRGPWAEPPGVKLMILGSRFDGLTEPHLVYQVLVAYPKEPGRLPVREEIYVDAHGGQVLARLSRVRTAGGTPTTLSAIDLNGRSVTLNATLYDDGTLLEDSVSVSGARLLTVAGNSNYALYTAQGAPLTISDRQAVSVASAVSRAMKFNKDTFLWGSWNFDVKPTGAGGTFLGVTHVGDKMANAYFTVLSTSSGSKLGSVNFGDGDGNILRDTALCVDVIGHEIGHGIDESTAGFVYHNQSGALDEHFADFFGWMLDSSDHLMGEDCVGPAVQARAQALRDLCEPANASTSFQPQPATMADYKQLPDTQDTDWGGVHVNSGIPNRAACLFKTATSFETLGKVWFRAVSKHLGPTSQFRDMVQATMTSCTELGLSTCSTLSDAWTAVGLAPSSSGGTCPPNSTAQGTQCVCNTGYHVNSAGTGCEADASTTCPANSHAVGTDCYCDAGYVPNTAGTACVLQGSSGACGAHSHNEGGECVCDPCYQYATPEAASCTAISGCAVCTDPLQVSDGRGGCACEPGTTPSGNACAPVPGDCGNETYYGRCVGSVLVYCNDRSTPATIETGDCSQNTTNGKTACGLSDIGYDCVAPAASQCGSVPETGVCNTDGSASLCVNGTAERYDCRQHGCGSYTYMGAPVSFCFLCEPGSTYVDNPAGEVRCTPGSTGGGSGTSGGGSGGGGGGGGGSGGGSGGSLFGCTAAGGLSPALALAALALMLRRRR